MNPIGYAVSRPHTVAVVAILTVLFSWLAFRAIPVQLKPTVDVPRITVTTSYRGASAVEVEEQVTRELEDVLQSVDGLVEMTSISSENRSQITLEFAIGRDVQMAMVDVANKLGQIQPLPEEADEPVAAISSSTDRDMVMWIVAKSHYPTHEVRRIIEDDVISRLERVKGVSSVFVAGGSEREIQIRIDPDLLVGRNVTIDDVLSALASGNRNLRGGTVETDTRQLVVRTVGKAVIPAELEQLIVLDTERGSVRLGEVANVVDGPREKAGFLNMNGVPTIAMGVRRQVGSNVIEIVAELDRVLEEVLNPSFEDRGIDLSLTPIYRETEYITKAMSFVGDNLILGAALAIGVLLVGLRSLRSILVIVATIPTSLIAVFLVMQVFDRSLNVISLAGIAFASGMVVDNAIVVLENVFRHLEMGKFPRQAAVDGGREVWGGVLASTLTTVAVFVPILMQQDESSQLFKDIALTISAAVALSLVAALTIVPVLASLLYRSGRAIPAAERSKGRLARLYGAFCLRLEDHRPGDLGCKLGFVFLVAAASLATMRLAPPAEYLPTGNRNMIMFFATPISGTRPEAVAENYKRFEDFVMAQPEFERMFAVSGGFNGGGIILKDEYSDAASLESFQNRLFYGMTLPGFRSFVPVRSSIFRDPGKQFEVEISGPDFDTLESVAARVKARLERVASVTSVRSSLVTGRPELHVEIDEDRAKDLGLDVAAVGRVVETVVAGRRVSTMIDRGREVDVTVLAPQWRVSSPEDLESLSFLAPTGEVVTLGSVATVTRTTGPESIRRLERERNVLLTVNIALDAPLESVLQIVENEVFPEIFAELPSATYTLGLGGSADKLKTTLDALTNGLGLSVLIIYLLLVSLFRSWLLPAVILVTVPLALSGGVLGIRLASWYSPGVAAFDVISMLGFVILAGLVVNNAILIVHQANNFREQGMSARRALTESARSRLRPILMSVTTTVFGMLPLAMGGGAGAELYQGLGAVIVGGLVVSTLFTLFLVPVLISIGHDLGLHSRPELDPAPEAIPAV